MLHILGQLLLVPLFVSVDIEKQLALQVQDLVERLHVVETLAALQLHVVVVVDWEDHHPHCFIIYDNIQ